MNFFKDSMSSQDYYLNNNQKKNKQTKSNRMCELDERVKSLTAQAW